MTPMLLIAETAELWIRAGWRMRASVHGAVNGSTQLVLQVWRVACRHNPIATRGDSFPCHGYMTWQVRFGFQSGEELGATKHAVDRTVWRTYCSEHTFLLTHFDAIRACSS